MRKKIKKITAVLLAVVIMSAVLSIGVVSASASTGGHSQADAVNWANSKINQSLDYDGAYGAQCVDLIMFYYQYLGNSSPGGNGCDYTWNALPSGWSRITNYSDFVPQPGDICVWGSYCWPATTEFGHVGIVISGNASNFNSVEQNVSGQYVQAISNRSTSSVTCFIRPDFNGGGSGEDVTTPTISFDKSSYIIGETAKITWSASPSGSGFKHYWLVIKNTTSGKQYYGTATGGNGDVSANHYELPLTELGTYKVDVYAVNQSGGGKSDSKTFGVGKYGLSTPTITLEKSSYTIGETAKISWTASPSESDFKHYWLVIKNTTIGKTYYGTATSGDGDVNANHYDLTLTESGVYKVDVYAVDHGGGGKSDSKTFGVGKYDIATPSISLDKNSYIEGETAKITWTASPSESDLKHYWLVIKNTTTGKTYYGTATGGDGDVNANHYDLPLTEVGTYKVDVYAVDHGGGGKSDSKTFVVVEYDLITPSISFDKNSYKVGETAKITWEASPAGAKFKHYWLVIKNTTTGKTYYGTATGGDGDVNANHYDIYLPEEGIYKVDVYAINQDGGGKSDSQTILVSNDLFDIGDVNGDENVDVLDAAMVQKYTVNRANLNEQQLLVADVNNDNHVDVLDAADIQKFAAGIISEFKKKV